MVHLRKYTRRKYIMFIRLLKMAIHTIHSSYASVHRISINLPVVSHRPLTMACVWCPSRPKSSPSVEVPFTMGPSTPTLDSITLLTILRSTMASSLQCPLIMATQQIRTSIHLRDIIIIHIWRLISQLGRLPGPILELWWDIHLLDTRIQILLEYIQPRLRTINLHLTMILDTRARSKLINTLKRASSSIICSNRIEVWKKVAAVLSKVKISDTDPALTLALKWIKLKINKKMAQKMQAWITERDLWQLLTTKTPQCWHKGHLTKVVTTTIDQPFQADIANEWLTMHKEVVLWMRANKAWAIDPGQFLHLNNNRTNRSLDLVGDNLWVAMSTNQRCSNKAFMTRQSITDQPWNKSRC